MLSSASENGEKSYLGTVRNQFSGVGREVLSGAKAASEVLYRWVAPEEISE